MKLARTLALVLALPLAAASVGCSERDTPVLEDDAVLDCSTCSNLHSRDRLRVAAERENTRWGDMNIASGTATIAAGRLDDTADSEIMMAAAGLLEANFRSDRDEAIDAEAISVDEPAPFDLHGPYDWAVEEVAERVASHGFAFAPENERDRAVLYWSIQHTIDWLGNSDADVVATTARATYHDGDSEKAITLTVFASRDTAKYVAVYSREDEF